jgi:hypothetical protein
VKSRRLLLLALLVYVALDLSCADMPGAFMFEPEDSVESVDVPRTRLTGKIVALPAPIMDSVSLSQPRSDFRHRVPTLSRVARVGRPVVSCLPRAHCDPARPSEDSH